jgi:ABC-type uncharacterized transport system auxiliary subunit
MKALLTALLALPLLAGCFGGFDSRQMPPDTFVLVAADSVPGKTGPVKSELPAAATSAEPRGAGLAGTLTVRLPRARGGWNNQALPVRLPDGRRDRLAAAAWASPVDEGVGTVMADTLRYRGAFAAVLADTSPFAGKWVLELEIAEFSARYARVGEPPSVEVLLTGVVGRGRTGTVLGAVEGKASVPAVADTRTAIAAAFVTAVQQATAQVAVQTEQLAGADR